MAVLLMLLISASILLAPISPIVSAALMFMAFIMALPPLATYAFEYSFGAVGPKYVERGLSYQLTKIGRKHRYIAFLEVSDVRHSIMDMDSLEYRSAVRHVAQALVAPGATVFLVLKRDYGGLKEYIGVSIIGSDEYDAKSRAVEILRIMRRHMESVGIVTSVPKEFPLPMPTKATVNPFTFGILAFLSIFISSSNPPFFVIGLCSAMLLALLAMQHINHGGYSLKGWHVYSLRENRSISTMPTAFELLTRARMFRTVLLSLRSRMAMIFSISPALISPLARAQKMYELGTALDKLSMIFSASKWATATRRVEEHGEAILNVEVIGMFGNRDEGLRVVEALKHSGLILEECRLRSLATHIIFYA